MVLQNAEYEKMRLVKLLEVAERDVNRAPKGKLRITSANGVPVYYHREEPSDKIGKYISQGDREVARKLAQKRYAEKMIIEIKHQIDLLDKLVEYGKDSRFLEIYEKNNPQRRKLITPYVISDEEYVKQWLEKGDDEATGSPSEHDSFENMIKEESEEKDKWDNRIFTTANGEYVRSKSEVIIADTLARLGIPYVYEKPFYYDEDKSFNPDFTVLNVKRRKEIYIEHFGKMGAEDYMDSFFWKMKKFGKIGILQGDNLLMTFEDKEHQFNIADYIPDIKRMRLE